jgi:hypothetical protein
MATQQLFKVVEVVTTTYLVQAQSRDKAELVVATRQVTPLAGMVLQTKTTQVARPVGLWDGEVQ